MRIFQHLLSKLRAGTATEDEIEKLDRRGFLLGVSATAAGLVVARPRVVDMRPQGTNSWASAITRQEIYGEYVFRPGTYRVGVETVYQRRDGR